jgi:predicted DNA-binding ribbon-helix-helix protein
LKKYSINISGHATSITLEEVFWQALKQIATQNNQSIAKIVSEIDKDMNLSNKNNLSSNIRIYVLKYWMNKN